MRGSELVSMLCSCCGVGRCIVESERLTPLEEDVEGPIFISFIVPHWLQAGHLPNHFTLSCPQFSQTYAVLSFAIFIVSSYLKRCALSVYLLLQLGPLPAVVLLPLLSGLLRNGLPVAKRVPSL